MTSRLMSALILAVGLIMAAFIHSGGIYHIAMAGADKPFMWRVNKFTVMGDVGSKAVSGF